MTQEVFPGIFQIIVPLPDNPLRHLNSYLIRGSKRSLLVDTGFNWPECKEALHKGVASVGVDWSQVDFFITHIHADHSGLVYDLAEKDSRIYCSKTDADIIKDLTSVSRWDKINDLFLKHGYPLELLTNEAETIHHYISGTNMDFTYVDDGDVLEYGGYNLFCIATPGHSPGHICLYEPEHKFFISGDHILAGITSNITVWDGTDDSLGLYLSSLDKVDAMDIKLVLPGHRHLIDDCHGRVMALKQHHANRLQETIDILQAGPMSAYDVAGNMHWNLVYDSWETFPQYQKWFATGEVIAHLEHLVTLKKVIKLEQNEKWLYKLSDY